MLNKKILSAAVVVALGSVAAINTASAASLTLSFANNASATTIPGGNAGFDAGSEFHVATPSYGSLNDGHKDIISGDEVWTFSNGLSNTSVVSSNLTAFSGGGTNTGQSGTSGQNALSSGLAGFPIAPTPGTNATLFDGADFLGAGDFTILGNTTATLSGAAFGPAHISAFDTVAGTFNVHFPVLHVQWAQGAYLIGGDATPNPSNTDKCNGAAPNRCVGSPGFDLVGTLSGGASGTFTLTGTQAMTFDEVTVGGFNKQIVEFSLQGDYNTTFDHASAAVPVPAAAWLFGSGLMGMVGVARRRRNKEA